MVDRSNGCSEVVCFHFGPSYITVSMCICIHTSQYDDTMDLRVSATIELVLSVVEISRSLPRQPMRYCPFYLQKNSMFPGLVTQEVMRLFSEAL